MGTPFMTVWLERSLIAWPPICASFETSPITGQAAAEPAVSLTRVVCGEAAGFRRVARLQRRHLVALLVENVLVAPLVVEFRTPVVIHHWSSPVSGTAGLALYTLRTGPGLNVFFLNFWMVAGRPCLALRRSLRRLSLTHLARPILPLWPSSEQPMAKP